MNVAIVSCFDTFMDRQNALVEIFRSRGDHVQAFLSDFQHVSKSYRTEAPASYTLVHAKAYKKNLSLKRMYSHSRYASDVVHAIAQENWDLVWAIVPPNSLVKECAAFKKEHPSTKLVFDVNDLWPESFPLGGLKKLPPFQLWQARRDRYLPVADHIVTECDLFRSRLRLQHSDKATTVYFCKMEPEGVLDRRSTLAEDYFSICYLGSMNHIIDIDAIVAVIQSMQKQRPVHLHMVGTGESRQQLISSVQSVGAEVIDHGPVYDAAEKQSIFNQCHFGLNTMKPTVCVGLTMKSIDYLAGGLPLINSIPGDTWDLIERYGFGINWQKNDMPDWNRFDQQTARKSARDFFEQHLAYQNFSRNVESVLAKI